MLINIKKKNFFFINNNYPNNYPEGQAYLLPVPPWVHSKSGAVRLKVCSKNCEYDAWDAWRWSECVRKTLGGGWAGHGLGQARSKLFRQPRRAGWGSEKVGVSKVGSSCHSAPRQCWNVAFLSPPRQSKIPTRIKFGLLPTLERGCPDNFS